MSDPRPSDDQSRERRALGAPALDDVRDALEAGVRAYRKGDFSDAKNQAETALRHNAAARARFELSESV